MADVDKKNDIEMGARAYDDVDPNTILSPEQQKAVMRKIDWHLIPLLSILYLFNFLDRTNIGNARILNVEEGRGMQVDLGITADQWNWVVTSFFFGYIIFEVPSNLIIKKVSPSRWIARICFSWGICATCLGFCNDFISSVVVRILLGIAEAGFFPGIIFYMTFWYTQKEFSLRVSIFYCSATVAGAFSGLLAYGISFMNGVGGYAGWRWLFILEGIPSVILGFVNWYAMTDYPHVATWLTPEEKRWCEARMPKDGSNAHEEKFSWDEIIETCKSVQTWLLIAFGTPVVVALYALAFYMPTIIKNMGFVSTTAQLLTVPPNIFAWFFSALISWNSDRTGERVYHMTLVILMAGTGFLLFGYVDTVAVQYFGTFLAAGGVSPFVPLIWGYRTSMPMGTTGTAFGVALLNALANVGGAVAPQAFGSQYGPRFRTSFLICALCALIPLGFLHVSNYLRLKAIREQEEAKRNAGVN